MSGETDVIDVPGAGRRSDHPSSADRWADRDRAEAGRELALPTELGGGRNAAVVGPLVVAERAREMEAAFQALCENVLTEDDHAYYKVKKQRLETLANGATVLREIEVIEKRKRKSAWRKLARYFNIDVTITKEVIGHRHVEQGPAACSRIVLARNGTPLRDDEDCACPTAYARFHVRVTAPNSRQGWGVGVCSLNERGFKAQDHSIPATAFTRAVSRAVSDMIGAGESSSDDPAVTHDAPAGEAEARPVPSGGPLTQEQVLAYVEAFKAASQDQKRATVKLVRERGYADNFVAQGAPDYEDVMQALGAPVPPGIGTTPPGMAEEPLPTEGGRT